MAIKFESYGKWLQKRKNKDPNDIVADYYEEDELELQRDKVEWKSWSFKDQENFLVKRLLRVARYDDKIQQCKDEDGFIPLAAILNQASITPQPT